MSKNTQRQTTGKLGEDEAAGYLQNNGYRIIERNWSTRYAEIDIVAIEHNTLVFIEVRTRAKSSRQIPKETITSGKLKNLIRSAQLYVSRHPNFPENLRIDFVGVILEGKKVVSLNLIKNITQ